MFKDGLARVEDGAKNGYIDHAGRLVIPCVWDGASHFSEGLANVRLNKTLLDSMTYIINKQGQVLCNIRR